MKREIALVLCLLCTTACFGQTPVSQSQIVGLQHPVPDPNAPRFRFDHPAHDFGVLPEGPVATYDFKFKNMGKQPIIISDAHGSCGCTTASWPHDPVRSNKSGVIHVMLNTLNRPGNFAKDIIISSNAVQNPMILHITGTVKPKKAGK